MDDNDGWEDEEMGKDATMLPTDPTLIPLPKPADSDLTTTLPSEQVEDEIL